MSDEESDPRFRIPRGESDEEIDSDLASVASLDTRPDPKDISHDSATKSKRDAINAAAGVLRKGLNSASDTDSGADDEALDDEAPDAAALSAVTLAATGRRDLSSAARRAARNVIPAGNEKPLPVPHRDGKGQDDMMARMLHVLSGGAEKNVSHGGEPATPVAGLADLKKKVARLSASGKKPLAVPLPEPVQGRIERSEAYKIAKEEVSEKWAGIVAKNRKADKLVFTTGGMGETVGRNTGVVAEGFKASNEYEKEIEQMLKSAGVVNDAQVVNNEEKDFKDQLGTAGVSKQELLERRRELAKVRSLMFHYEHKMKRIKKIKSRKYRRIMKKEKEKLAEKRLDGSEDDDIGDERMRKERRRAEERMTLRHKNTSKWVRRQLQRGETRRNPETRAAVEEQLQLHEELKRRQEGVMEDSDESDSEGSGYGEHATEEQLDAEIEDVRKELEEDEEDDRSRGSKRKGLMGMKFMQVAEERQRKEAQALLDEMGEDGSDEEGTEGKRPAAIGRQSFSGGAVDASKKLNGKRTNAGTVTDGVLSDDEEGEEERDDAKELKKRVELEYQESAKQAAPGMGGESVGRSEKLSKALMGASKTKNGFTTRLDGKLKASSTNMEENPWLQERGNGADEKDEDLEERVRSGREKKALVEENGNVAIVKRQTRKEVEAKGQNGISVGVMREDEKMELKESKKKKRRVEFAEAPDLKKQEKTRVNVDSEEENEGDGAGVEWESDEIARMKLVAKAFEGAGGADEAEFAAMKEASIDRSVPKASDIGAEVLPGWGSWDGAGMKKGRRKESAFAIAARERLAAARSAAISKRKDRGLKHVILDERRVKQAADLTVASVPFPFKSREQWEREVGRPVCKEFAGGREFGELVEGRVRKKVGVAIKPMSLGSGKRAVIEGRRRKARERDTGRKALLM